jgi:signal transduction histidine kinase
VGLTANQRTRVIDVLTVVVVTGLLLYGVWRGEGPDESFAEKPLSSVLLVPCGLALWWRRSRPVAVAGVYCAGLLAQAVATGVVAQSPGLALCGIVALYSLGAYATTWRALAGGLAMALALQLKSSILTESSPDASPFVWAFWNLLMVSVVGLGMLVRLARRSAAQDRQARIREAEREQHAQAAVAEERARIARELHDVVSHNVSASVLQAGAAEELLRREPERAAESLRSIQDMGREALGEMRRMLGILRPAHDGSPPAPQPRLSDLGALLERAHDTGLDAALVVEGPVVDLPPGIELSAYRIVQEALTNAAKHAGPCKVVVTTRYLGDRLEIDVTDDGRGAAAADPGTGHGLIGMGERVEFLGGTLEAGPGHEGGFTVCARFPVPGSWNAGGRRAL